MMDALNRYAAEYAGLIAVAGIILALGSVLAAVYFYYNPRRSRYSISYKIFARGIISQSIRRFRNALSTDGDNTFPQYVDLWNSGGDPIANEVIREPIILALQPSATGKGISLVDAEVVRETHPGVSGFQIRLHDTGAQLVWTHFDPGMGVRVRLSSTEPVGADQIAVFGQGLRLSFKRIRNLSEIGGLPTIIQKAVVTSCPMALAFALGGPAVGWMSHQEVSGFLAYVGFAVIAILVVALLIGGVVSGLFLNNAIEWIFNTKSPIELTEGDPSMRSRSEEMSARAAEIEMLRAEADFRDRMVGKSGQPGGDATEFP